MAKSVDALVSGTSGRKAVQVRVLFRAHKKASQLSDAFLVPVGTHIYWGTAPDPSASGRSGDAGKSGTKKACFVPGRHPNPNSGT